MINIRKPMITENGDRCRLLSIIEIDGQTKELWYDVNKGLSRYLTDDRSDAFVVALLIYAMKNKHSIECEAPLSSKLYYSLREYLIPFLCNINKELSPITIKTELTDEVYETSTHIGTGISCGIDSLSTIIKHGINEDIEDYKIDTLTLFNSGYYGSGEGSSRMFREYQAQSVSFSDKFSYTFLEVDANLRDFLVYKFNSQVTYLTCSTVLALQKYFKKYFFASSYPFHRMEPNFVSTGYYEVLILQALSTETVEFYSGCCEMTRTEKTKLVYDNHEVFDYIYPCLSGKLGINCGRCEKCIRALLTFDGYKLLDKIESRFNTKYYKKRRSFLISVMLMERYKLLSLHYIFNEEIYKVFLENKNIPFTAWLLLPIAFIYVVCMNTKNKLKQIVKSFLEKHTSEKTINKIRRLLKKEKKSN